MPRDGATEIPRTILAQVSDASQTADGASQPSTAPPTGQVRQATIPPAGQIREPGRIDDPPNLRIGDPGAPPTGSPDDPLLNEPTTNEILGADDATGGIAAGPAIRIGTLTVNQNGIGRMQQIVEGVQVQDVIGQALTIYSPNLAVGANNQSNLNPVADPITGRPAVTPEGGALRQPAPRTPAGGAPIGPTANRVLRPGNTISAAGNANANMNLPVAGGVIEELSGASLDALGTGGLPASDLNAPVANQANPGAQSEQLLAPVTGPQGVTDFPRNGQRPINPAPPAPLRDSGVQPPARVDPQ
jgi:hypothetical protein